MTSARRVSNEDLLSVTIPILTDWAAYTATFTGLGTVSVSSFWWRQIGSNIEIRGTFTTGTVTGVEARITLPTAFTSHSNISTVELAGNFARNTTAAAITERVLIEPSVAYMTFGIQSAAAVALTKTTGTLGFGSAFNYSLQATIPIAGSATQTIGQMLGLS